MIMCVYFLFISLIQEHVNIIQIEMPNTLVFYNEYEELIDSPTFPEFSPFTILQRNTLLSDGLTSAMLVEYNKRKYYVKKDDSKKLVNHKRAGKIHLLHSVKKQNKEIRIHKDIARYKTVYSTKDTETFIPGIYTFLFEKNGYYLVTDTKYRLYRWIKSSDKRFYTIEKRAKHTSSQYVELLRNEVSRANTLYEKILKSVPNASFTSPVWSFDDQSDAFVFSLFCDKPSLNDSLFKDMEQMIRRVPDFEKAIIKIENTRIRVLK